jgi:uncharacterized membrane protein YfcA
MDETFKYWTRRIIALAFCIGGVGVFSYLALTGNDQALTALVATVGAIIGFYFGTRQDT